MISCRSIRCVRAGRVRVSASNVASTAQVSDATRRVDDLDRVVLAHGHDDDAEDRLDDVEARNDGGGKLHRTDARPVAAATPEDPEGEQEHRPRPCPMDEVDHHVVVQRREQ